MKAELRLSSDPIQPTELLISPEDKSEACLLRLALQANAAGLVVSGYGGITIVKILFSDKP